MAPRQRRQLGGTENQLRHQIKRLLTGKAHGDARLGECVHEVEDIGRAAAHQRHERVELLFRQHDGGAQQPEQIENHAEHVFGQCRVFLNAEHAGPHEGGGIRHDARHMAAALHRIAQLVQRNPGGDGNDDCFRFQGGQGCG